MKKCVIMFFLMGVVVLCMSASSYGITCAGSILAGDINKDCYVNFKDFAMLAANWLDVQQIYVYTTSPATGWFCPMADNCVLPTSITVSGIDGVNNRLTLSIYDGISLNYDLAGIRTITLTPTGNGSPIVSQSTTWSIIASNPDPNYQDAYVEAGDVEADGTYTLFMFAPGTMNATGWGTVALNQAIPNGTYTVSLHYITGAVHADSGAHDGIKMGVTGSGTYVENGNPVNVGGWYYYSPCSDYGVTTGGVYDTSFASPAKSVPVLKTTVIQSTDCSIIASNPDPNYQDAYVEAGDVEADGTYTLFMYAPGTMNATGWGTIAANVAIPNGTYAVSLHYITGAVHTVVQDGTAMDGVKMGITGPSGTYVENGNPVNVGGWYYYSPCSDYGVTTGGVYDTSFASPAGSAGWFCPMADNCVLPTSITVSGIDGVNNRLTLSIYDGISLNYDLAGIRTITFKQMVGPNITAMNGDLNDDLTVNFEDMAIFAENWLQCNDSSNPNCHDIVCPNTPPEGITEYTAYRVTGPVTLDGTLNGWPAFDGNSPTPCTAKWVPVNKVYYGTPYNVDNAYMCLMYDPNANVLYGAVTVDDYDPVYGYTTWNGEDHLEIYIKGDPNNNTPVSPYGTWANAQQFIIGLNSDAITTYVLWPDSNSVTSMQPTRGNPGVQAFVKSTPGAGYLNTVVYEFKIVPYNNYGGINATTTVQSHLYSGKTIGFDVVLADASTDPAGFGMLCPNTLTNKAYDVTKYATVTCH